MVSMMNIGHSLLADWGMRFANIPADAVVLDCGCGGGANIAKLLSKCPEGKVMGIDYSDISVKKSRKVNRSAIESGRCAILNASAAALPFEDAGFNFVTAFETVYFWQEPERCFREIFRVLKPDGTLLICNECCGENPKDEKWTEMIDGMKIYKDNELKALLEEAGFGDVTSHKSEKGWLCVTARKRV